MIQRLPSRLLQLLVVDGNTDDVGAIIHALDQLSINIQITVADTIAQALFLIQSHPPDVIVSDYQLADGDCMPLILQDFQPPCFPVIIFSAQNDVNTAVNLLKSGAQDYIVKSHETFAALGDVLSKNMEKWQHILAQRESKRTLSKLKQAVDQSPSAILITNVNNEIEFANPRSTEVSGYSLQECLGRNPNMFKSGHHSAEFYEHFWNTINSGNIWRGEMYNRRKDGTLYWESAVVSAIRNEQGEVTNFVAVKENINRRKLAEEYTKQLMRTLFRRQDEERKHLSKELHDGIGQSLAAIKHRAEILALKHPEHTDINADSHKLVKAIAGTITDVRKISHHMRPIEFENIDFKSALEQIIENFQYRSQIAVNFSQNFNHPASKLPGYIAMALFRIVQEALMNIEKHAEASTVNIRAASDHYQFSITIQDDGRGLSQRNFVNGPRSGPDLKGPETYEPGEIEPKNNEQKGIGLINIRERVADLGGDFAICSDTDQGTTLKITIPLHV